MIKRCSLNAFTFIFLSDADLEWTLRAISFVKIPTENNDYTANIEGKVIRQLSNISVLLVLSYTPNCKKQKCKLQMNIRTHVGNSVRYS